MSFFSRRARNSSQSSPGEFQQLYGVHLLYGPPDPSVDIIAVHGLGGHPFNTWTIENKEGSILWLRDLLPKDLPDARILSYGYDANFFALLGSTSSDRVLQHAKTLVSLITADREIDGGSQRPIIFVCHSLGGIIVKRALAYSANQTNTEYSNLSSVKICSYGILFLATPHKGSSKAFWALTLQRIIEALEGSEVLQNITDMFTPLMKDLKITFFWERDKMKLPTGISYIVEESSAAPLISNTERCGIPGDHRTICRYQNRLDPGYRLILATIVRLVEEAPDVVSRRWT